MEGKQKEQLVTIVNARTLNTVMIAPEVAKVCRVVNGQYLTHHEFHQILQTNAMWQIEQLKQREAKEK